MQVDQSGDGHVTHEEFRQIMQDPAVKTWLSVIGLDVHEVDGLFAMLDNGDGLVSFDEFVGGIARLKGGAKSVDVMTMLYENQKLSNRLMELAATQNNMWILLQSWQGTFSEMGAFLEESSNEPLMGA
jgi:hypothetical protein